MAENSMKPHIRFKGYTDAWEQRKLNSIAEKVTKKNENTCITETFTNSAEFGIISQRDYFDHDISNFDNLSGYYVVQNNDFVYNPRISVTAPVGPINRNKLGRKGVMSPLYTVFRVSNADFTFLEWYFKSNHWHGFMKFNGDSGARSDRFSIKDEVMFQMPLPYPNIYEQIIVGEFLSKVDNLITLHQRKYDKFVNIKKALLEKMFPQGDETTPKIRFKGFTDAWEQRKLGDIVDRVVRKNSNLESTLPLTISAQYGLVDQVEYFNSRVASRDVSGYYLVKNGEFAYNKSYSDGYPFGAIKRLDMYKMGVLSTLYIVFAIKSNEIDSEYLIAYYETDKWHRQVAERAAEGARNHGLLNISAADFFETKLKHPFEIGEQRKIGQLFRRLDNLITLHQRQLEKLKNIKSALLEKMFV